MIVISLIYHLLPDPVDVGVAVRVVLGEGKRFTVIPCKFNLNRRGSDLRRLGSVPGIQQCKDYLRLVRRCFIFDCNALLQLGGGPIALTQPVPVKGEGHIRAGFQPLTRVLVQPDFLRLERSLAGQDELEGAAVIYRIGVRSVVVHSAVVVQRLEVVLRVRQEALRAVSQFLRR